MTTTFSSLYFLCNFLTRFFVAVLVVDRKNKNAEPEYAVWVKNKDKSMNNPALFIGQKTAMEKVFGNKISLVPKLLADLN
jgi:hypothetical protein